MICFFCGIRIILFYFARSAINFHGNLEGDKQRYNVISADERQWQKEVSPCLGEY